LGLVAVPPFSSVTTVRLRTRAVAMTNGSAPLRFLVAFINSGCCARTSLVALDGLIKRHEHVRARVDPLGELVLLPCQLNTHLVGAEHLLLGDEFVQLVP
jgi:hypothetical protein